MIGIADHLEGDAVGDVIDNGSKARFEVTREGHTADLTYKVDGDRITLIHTNVPDALEGHGVGGELVQAAVDRAARDGLTIEPVCPYARHWLRKHTDALGDVPIDWTQESLS
jgi:predicted GNAT family acetyltransferase